MNYNNEAYTEMIETIFQDLSIEQLSTSAKLMNIRKYTEIVVRRILKLPNEQSVMLGNIDIIQELKTRGYYTHHFFKTNYDLLRSKGNANSHTQIRRENGQPGSNATDEVNEALNALMNLYSFMFYKFFKDYSFKNTQIIRAFSILPPIIRYNCLKLLHEDSPRDTLIIEKYILAMIKSFDNEFATNWIYQNQELLESIPLYDEQSLQVLSNISPFIASAFSSKTVFDKALELVSLPFPPLYKNLKEAKQLYLQNGILHEKTEECMEFNDLMEFVYIGRD